MFANTDDPSAAVRWQAELELRGQSARSLLGPVHKIALGALIATVLALALAEPVAATIALIALVTAVYVVTSGYKLLLVMRSVASERTGIAVEPAELATLDESTLPIYTVLVPLYREAVIVPHLLAGLARLDYPTDKLDVKLLLEADDEETIAAVQRAELPGWIEPILVPPGMPRTKPRACNYGLAAARGEFVVIYDAEDVPDPDQLKKAVVSFRRLGGEVICLQAKLNYYNPRQNLLTRLFTIEYSTWFDLLLPGLHVSGAPIPLGGTSNHFRVAALRNLAAWDAFNVAEDCDLGTRIYTTGQRVAVLDSTTWEEANSRLGNWLRQRSRWLKGYIQTYWVHTRHARQFIGQLGWKRFAAFQLFVGGTVVTLLLNPLFWTLTAAYFLTRWHAIDQLFPWPVYYAGLANMMVGNFLFLYMNLFGPIQRDEHDLAKYSLLMPIYWVLMSAAAWKGALQLLTRPHFWEKTVHGLVERGSDGADAATG
ncbi:MAG: glycosyltransferase [Chloroflexi bacterium]|nr:glycosyltransferase [Chloroflexota bacterium]